MILDTFDTKELITKTFKFDITLDMMDMLT